MMKMGLLDKMFVFNVLIVAMILVCVSLVRSRQHMGRALVLMVFLDSLTCKYIDEYVE